MLRISQLSDLSTPPTLRLEGEVAGRWVEELRRECGRMLRERRSNRDRLVLDVAEVSHIDAAGRALFQELIAQRVIVANCSAFLAELLKDVTDVDQ